MTGEIKISNSNQMTNNDILRRIRYIFDYSDSKMQEIFALANYKATRSEISNWLKQDDDHTFAICSDLHLSTFLNGFINEKRGKKEDPQPEAEKTLNNNIIFRKLKIALNLQADDVIKILTLSDFKISKHELSAFFRKSDHKHYRLCKEQILRNFLMGMQIKYRPEHDTATNLDSKTEN